MKIDLKAERELLMKFIDGVKSGDISREQIEERVKMFAIVVASESIGKATKLEESMLNQMDGHNDCDEMFSHVHFVKIPDGREMAVLLHIIESKEINTKKTKS